MATMKEKENPMIELSQEQLRALDTEAQPVSAIDPRTGQVYRLIKQEVYDLVCGIIKPYNRGWDPDDDLIRRKDADEQR
jgi:hypothetical protein